MAPTLCIPGSRYIFKAFVIKFKYYLVINIEPIKWKKANKQTIATLYNNKVRGKTLVVKLFLLSLYSIKIFNCKLIHYLYP